MNARSRSDDAPFVAGWMNRAAGSRRACLAAALAMGSLAALAATAAPEAAGGQAATGGQVAGASAAGAPAAGAQAAPTAGGQLTPELIRERTEREWDVKAEKMRRRLLPLMRAHEIDLWIILSRENAPDPALELFGGYGITGWYGHRNAYLFHDAGEDGLQTTVLGTHLSGHLARFYDTRELYGEEGLAPHLRRYVEARDPRRIAVNQSRTISMADGLTAELKEYLLDAVGPRYRDRIVSSEPLLVEYVSTRTPAEDAIQREASAATFAILRRALSNEVIAPGRTTLLDVHYWITAEWKRQGFEFNFPASVDLQRPGAEPRDSDDAVIRPGRPAARRLRRAQLRHRGRPAEDGLRAAAGRGGSAGRVARRVRALEPDGRDPPGGVRTRPHRHRHQDRGRGARRRRGDRRAGLLARPGQLGARRRRLDGLRLAGPLRRHPRFPLRAGEWISLEFSVTAPAPEWDGQAVTIMREEDTLVHGDGRVEYLSGPQTELWLIR